MHLPARIRHQIRSRTTTRIASAGCRMTAAAIIQAGARSLCKAPPRLRRFSTRRAPSTEIRAETVSANTTSSPRQSGRSVNACTPYPIAARSTSTTTANAGTVRVQSAQERTACLLCATITSHGTTSERQVPIHRGAAVDDDLETIDNPSLFSRLINNQTPDCLARKEDQRLRAEPKSPRTISRPADRANCLNADEP